MEVRLYEFYKSTLFRRIGITYLATGHYAESKYGVGEFELSIPMEAAFAVEFSTDRLVLIDRRYWGVITGRKLDNGSENTITVKGKELKDWLARRQIVPDNQVTDNVPMGYDSAEGWTESILKHYVENHAVSPQNPARRFPMLRIAPDQHRGTENDAYYARFVNLMDTLEIVGKRANLGTRITGDEQTGLFTFDVYGQTDRTVNQTTNKPLLLDVGRHNLDASSYTEEYGQSGNVFYCSRSGDEFEWETLTQTYFSTDDEPQWFLRREKAMSISVYEDGNQYEELEKNARKEMVKYRPAQELTCTVSRGLIYGTDYRLGDIVTVRNGEAGILADMEITAVDTVVTAESTSYTVSFGEQQLTTLDQIRRDSK